MTEKAAAAVDPLQDLTRCYGALEKAKETEAKTKKAWDDAARALDDARGSLNDCLVKLAAGSKK